MKSLLAQGASTLKPHDSLQRLPQPRSNGSVPPSITGSRSDFEISTTSASLSSEDDVSTIQNSIDGHVAAIIRARKAIRDAIDRESGPNDRLPQGTALASTEALIRARQLLRLEKVEKKASSVIPYSQSSQQNAIAAPNASNQRDLNLSKSANTDASDTSSTENSDGSSVSIMEPTTPLLSENSNCHPDEVVIVVPTTPSIGLGDDTSVASDVGRNTGGIESFDILHAPTFKLELANDVESTPNSQDEPTKKSSTEYCSPSASLEVVSVSPSVMEKVNACIEQVTSLHIRNLPVPADWCKTQEPGLPENLSLTSTESLDGIDSGVFKHVSLKVRDLIDDLPQYKQKLNENDEKPSIGSATMLIDSRNTDIPKDFEMPIDYLISYLSSQKPEPARQDPLPLDDFLSSHIDNDPPVITNEFSIAQEPEMNPKKEISTTCDADELNNSCDPEADKPILHDELGELNHPIPNESIQFIDYNTDRSVHIANEKVEQSPNRRVTLLTIPNILDESDRSYEVSLDPDGLYPAHRDYFTAVRNLYVLLSGVDDGTEQDVHLFGQLIRFSFPFMLNSSDLSAFADSQILTRAKELQVSMVLVDRYLDTIHNMQGDFLEKYDNLDNLKEITLLVHDLCVHIEVESDNGVELECNGPNVLILNQNIPTDVFEIEANNGFVSKEYRTSDGEEPWWEVAARLNGTPYLDELRNEATNGILAIPSDCGVINDADTNDDLLPENKTSNTIDSDISEFWKDRREARRLETENLKAKGLKQYRSLARDDQNIGKACSFSHMEASKRLHGSLTAGRTWSDSSVRSMPQISRRDIHRKWSSKLAMADGTVTTRKTISAVDATMLLQKKSTLQNSFPFSNVWRNSYEKLTENHEGYFDVDLYSLYASTVVGTMRHTLDNVPWESRSVKQRFLYEQSISFTRNWFGCLTAIKINPKVKEPVCRPTEEWYRLAKSSSGHLKTVESLDDFDDDSWEDVPECGKIKTMRLRPGERISRLTPDLTCYLRRSRWRKKHFSEGNFPCI
jgi:hypothetical protein